MELTVLTTMCVVMLLSGGYSIYVMHKDSKELQRAINKYLESVAIESQRINEIGRDAMEPLQSNRIGKSSHEKWTCKKK